MGLRTDFLRAVLQDLPTPDSTLTEPSPRWDELLGGRTGPNDWGHYERSKGTTCIVFTNGEAISAGFPGDMIVTGPTPGGAGTPILQAQHAGAKARGWYHTPERGVLPNLRPGDIYEINHIRDDGKDGTHEGIILSVTPSADGQSLEVETADGGQGSWDKQSASRQKRTFSLSSGAHPVTVKSKYSSGWLQSWISVGGDEDDGTGGGEQPPGGSSPSPSTFDSPVSSAPAMAPKGGSGEAGPDPLAVGAALAGAGLLLLGLALRVKSSNVNVVSAGRPKLVNLTFNFPYRTGCWNDEDAARRRALEERLTRAGVEMTGVGSMMGCGKDAGMDIDVETRTPRATEALVRRLARQSGLKVGDVRPWS